MLHKLNIHNRCIQLYASLTLHIAYLHMYTPVILPYTTIEVVYITTLKPDTKHSYFPLS